MLAHRLFALLIPKLGDALLGPLCPLLILGRPVPLRQRCTTLIEQLVLLRHTLVDIHIAFHLDVSNKSHVSNRETTKTSLPPACLFFFLSHFSLDLCRKISAPSSGSKSKTMSRNESPRFSRTDKLTRHGQSMSSDALMRRSHTRLQCADQLALPRGSSFHP